MLFVLPCIGPDIILVGAMSPVLGLHILELLISLQFIIIEK